MAEITQVISPIPESGHRGVDSRDVFVTKQESYQDHQRVTLQPQLTEYASQVNAVRTEMNQLKSETSSAASVATSANNQAKSYATQAQGYRDEAEVIKSQTQAIADDLVIPTEVTYNQAALDSKFKSIKTRQFLNFNF